MSAAHRCRFQRARFERALAVEQAEKYADALRLAIEQRNQARAKLARLRTFVETVRKIQEQLSVGLYHDEPGIERTVQDALWQALNRVGALDGLSE